MNRNICNNCGDEYDYRHGRWICRSCGAYKPEDISNEEITLLYTAFQRLRLAEFHEAELEFDDIIHKYPENPDAYWGRLMSKYGIKYEQDLDGRMIPTCYAASIESVLQADDYQQALRHADEDCKSYYQKQAEYIERVRCEWIEKAKREKPYDIFLCYKDSDLANGIERTEDSIAAQELYIHLTNKGYRVFYSRETLRDKAGEKYEPYIFHALATAKVMLVYGSKPEYITSAWLKNEWTRYEKRIQMGEKKPNSLLVACDGFSPSELPTALSATQCLDATDKRFYSNLEETIQNIICPEKEQRVGAYVSDSEKKKSKILPVVLAIALLSMAGMGILLWKSLTDCNHIAKVDAAVEPTCILEGLTEGAHCYICNEILIEQKAVPKLAHTPGREASCTAPQTCTVCSTELAEALGHSYNVAVTAPTCAKQGYTTYTCHCGDQYVSDYVNTIPHIPGASATCTASQNCTVCGTELAQKLPHTPGAAATCTASQNCTVCGAELAEALGHSHSIAVTAPTCAKQGYTTYTCHCGDQYIGDYVNTIPHTPGAEATCTSAQVCILCNKELASSKGHIWGNWVTTIYATKTENGLKERKCTVCQAVLSSETIPAIGSIGLSFTLSGDSCCITGIGTCTDADVVIPAVCNGKPVTSIGNNAFRYCYDLVSITIPDSVTSIGDRAFSNCSSLTSVTIPEGVTSIGYDVFNSCTNLTSIAIPDGVTSIGEYAFSGCDSLTAVTIPDSVTSIGGDAFFGCGNLVSINIPDGVTSIGDRTFFQCRSLTDVTIPNSVTSIGESAFLDCESLTSVTIPNSVTSIKSAAFYGCRMLSSIRFGGTTAQWSAISKDFNWNESVPAAEVICSDGIVNLK